MPHLERQIKNPGLQTNETLHVIGVIQNTVRWQSRYRLYREWLKEMCATPNVKVHIVEATYGDRHPECNDDVLDFNYLEVRTHSEVWLKENLINLAVKNLLPSDWKYMAWVDCDVHFRNPDWAMATMQQLQHYNIVQPWRHANDLDFHGNIMNTWTSFGSLCASGKPMWHDKSKGDHYTYAHSGYAWACNRYFYENVEKLPDFNIVGAGDHLMAWACVNKVDATMPKHISAGYRLACEDWERKAFFACAGMVGFTPGRIEHAWHGSKVKRQYWSRWDILTKNHYDPSKDLSYDSQGVIRLSGHNKFKIEHAIMRYNRERQEDAIND